LVDVPTFPIAATQTAMMNAAMKAYSTEVGPSSEIQKRFTLSKNGDMEIPLK